MPRMPMASAALVTRSAASRNRARPMPWSCQARSTARRASTATGMGFGIFRLNRPAAMSTVTAPESESVVGNDTFVMRDNVGSAGAADLVGAPPGV